MKFNRNIVNFLPLAALIFALTASATAAGPSSVAGKVYDLYVSQSFAPPPFPPFHDCARFTETQMCLDACGDCGALTIFPMGAENPNGALWIGSVPCGGLNLIAFGTSVDGAGLPGNSGGNVLGAVFVGTIQGTTFGAEGVENRACSLGASKLNPYRKQEQK